MDNVFEDKGYEIIPSPVTPAMLDVFRAMLDVQFPMNSAAGIRNLAEKSEPIRSLAEGLIGRTLVDQRIGGPARLVRSILFDKSRETNWQVAWHQDLAIAVESKADVPGFDNWSVKHGVHHVQPPIEILERMLTVRLHLDAANEENGALWVVPGSHKLGRIRADEAANIADRMGKHLCKVSAGDALLLRPLLLHASRKSTSMHPRRVIHLEYAVAQLPAPLKWAEGTDLLQARIYTLPRGRATDKR